MKKILTFAVALALAVTALTGCSSKPAARTPEELTQVYAEAITANGGEMVEYNPVVSEVKEGDISGMLLETLGLTEEQMDAFGISASMMNIKAYGIAAVMPTEGEEEAVKEALQGFIDRQKQGFEMYLVDQYEIANAAKLETLEDGTVLMVMCEDQDTVFDGIAADIQG